ncbi:MAG: inositol monophosphatase family protein [Acidimicrobiales bacterium]
MPPDAALLDELLVLALRVADDAASLLVEGLGRARADVATKSSLTDMVTEIDRASEALIVEELRAARPDDAIIGEEGTAETGTTGVRWLVDPVDGTTNYLYGHPGFSVSIAAEVHGVRAVGVVHDPLHDEVFAAVSGRGATRNGGAIHCSDKAELSTALVATGFSYDPARRRAQARVLERIVARVRDIRRMGAASVDLCSVACGRVDAYYERGLGPWDLAAGALIAAEAGARVGDLDGATELADTVLAAPPELFDPLASLLREAGAREA